MTIAARSYAFFYDDNDEKCSRVKGDAVSDE